MARGKTRRQPNDQSRTTLQLLVLGAAKVGPINPYVLHRDWGLSLGTAVPALRRLTKLGLLTQGASGGKRSAARYSLSPAGKEALTRSIDEVTGTLAPNDAASALRIVTLAYLLRMDDLISRCPVLLKATAMNLQAASAKAQANANFERRDRAFPIRLHRWLFFQAEAARLLGEAEALEKMSDELPSAGNSAVPNATNVTNPSEGSH